MSQRPGVEFASAILIGACGQLLFQQRDNIPTIGYPGWVGLFGGHREGEESFRQCVSREVHEEISYFVPPEDFELLGPYVGVTQDGRSLTGQHFLARGIPVDGLVVTEGSLVVVELAKLSDLLPRLAP